MKWRILFVVFTAGAVFVSTVAAAAAVAPTLPFVLPLFATTKEVAVREGKIPKPLLTLLLLLLLLGVSLMVREMDIGSLMGLLNLV
jgi:hypothetical protein